MFWDSSALIPCFVEESRSPQLLPLFRTDEQVVIWWLTPVECTSALERRRREGLAEAAYHEANELLADIGRTVDSISPHEEIREQAIELLRRHALRSSDALQLAAALVSSRRIGFLVPFVCLDERLRGAAGREGLPLLPG